jgi:hypothetical protein
MTILDVRFSDWIQKGVTLFINNAVVLLVSGVVALAITTITAGLLLGPMLAGLAVIVLNIQDDRLSRPTLNDLFKGFDYFLATLPVTLAFYVTAVVLVILNFIPYLGQIGYAVVASVVAAISVFTVFHLVARRIPPVKSAVIWWELFKANWGPLLGFFILASIIGGAGLLVLYVGLIVTLPLYMCILGVAYLSILKQSAEL